MKSTKVQTLGAVETCARTVYICLVLLIDGLGYITIYICVVLLIDGLGYITIYICLVLLIDGLGYITVL